MSATLRHIDKARVLAAQAKDAAGRTQSIGRTVATLSALLAELDLAVFQAQADAIDLAELEAYCAANHSQPPSVGSGAAQAVDGYAGNVARVVDHSSEVDHG